jgi:hypothetical protein
VCSGCSGNYEGETDGPEQAFPGDHTEDPSEPCGLPKFQAACHIRRLRLSKWRHKAQIKKARRQYQFEAAYEVFVGPDYIMEVRTVPAISRYCRNLESGEGFTAWDDSFHAREHSRRQSAKRYQTLDGFPFSTGYRRRAICSRWMNKGLAVIAQRARAALMFWRTSG